MPNNTNTLRYWFTVEALMYPDIPKPGLRKSFTLRYEDPFPWQKADSIGASDNFKYFVYFGLVQKKVLEAELFELYRSDVDTQKYDGNYSRNANGKTFLGAIEVSGSGEPLLKTLQLAAFSTAFAGRKNQKHIDSADTLNSLRTRAEQLLKLSATVKADGQWLKQLTKYLIEDLDWQPRELMAREQVHILQVPLTGKNGKRLSKIPEMDPINSFYLEDIERVLADAANGRGSAQVERYLNGGQVEPPKVDVTQAEVINDLLAPKKFPVGRWPSKFPLFLMQQVAVNTALSTLEKGGLFSVNGPPGTGKTTLLMDVIAARIVERAKVLVEFENPERAFSLGQNMFTYPPNASGATFQGSCHYVDERLRDFAIVVASANNKAVENITLDLPSVDKVHPQPLMLDNMHFEYFAAAAEAILNPDKAVGTAQANDQDEADLKDGEVESEEHGKIRCWGLISAPLGKKENRNRVAKYLSTFSPNTSVAKALENAQPHDLDWETARKRFVTAVEDVQKIQSKIAKFDSDVKLLQALMYKLKPAREHTANTAAAYQSAQEESRRLGEDYVLLEQDFSGNLAERTQYSKDWPWWRVLWSKLFDRHQFLAFQQRREELAQEYDNLRVKRTEIKKLCAVADHMARETLAAGRAAAAAAIALEKEIERLNAILTALASELGEAAFDLHRFKNLSASAREKMLPRSNNKYHILRAQVFLAAMHLHKAFVKAAGKPFETNFRLALAMLEQQAFLKPCLPKMAPHLWATFFLVVPVVSSTFASFSRCFRDLGREQIGMLLVDESGQAVPSHALGAIWRSKRALLVGDPLQVEPVMPMDRQLDAAILKYHKATEDHQLTRYSAQHLADRANMYGANVQQYDGEDLWVGAPLRVHRRCVDPMFSVSNSIAYNNKMVFGPDPEEEIKAEATRPLLGPSRWIHVASTEFDEHYCEAEGKAAAELVIEFHKRGLVSNPGNFPDLFVISPFKSVADRMTSLLSDRANEWAPQADEEKIGNWLKSHVGTVHAFQGKESETVLFVLGGSTGGARAWAATRPNIVNVAVTRAKRRLYVIGHRSMWEKTPFGETLSKALPPT